jgi:hypothetical protein
MIAALSAWFYLSLFGLVLVDAHKVYDRRPRLALFVGVNLAVSGLLMGLVIAGL